MASACRVLEASTTEPVCVGDVRWPGAQVSLPLALVLKAHDANDRHTSKESQDLVDMATALRRAHLGVWATESQPYVSALVAFERSGLAQNRLWTDALWAGLATTPPRVVGTVLFESAMDRIRPQPSVHINPSGVDELAAQMTTDDLTATVLHILSVYAGTSWVSALRTNQEAIARLEDTLTRLANNIPHPCLPAEAVHHLWRTARTALGPPPVTMLSNWIMRHMDEQAAHEALLWLICQQPEHCPQSEHIWPHMVNQNWSPNMPVVLWGDPNATAQPLVDVLNRMPRPNNPHAAVLVQSLCDRAALTQAVLPTDPDQDAEKERRGRRRM